MLSSSSSTTDKSIIAESGDHEFAELIFLLFSSDQDYEMYIPRVCSDPGAPRQDRKWREPLPQPPNKSYIRPIPRYQAPGSRCPTPISSANSMHMPQVPTGSIAMSALPVRTMPQENPRKRSWFMRILMAPCKAVEWLLKKWCTPSENCVRCVNVTYLLVLIIGGIVSAVAALRALL